MQEDRLLLRTLRQGDQGALRRIYEKYKDDLLTTASFLVGDRSTAEDCLHDAFVAFASQGPRLEIRTSLKGYLAACVANRARDTLRKASRQTPLPDVELAAEGTNPESAVLSHEDSARLAAALARLPYEQREVVALRIQGGLKFRQIAVELEISSNTARSRYRYGLEKLRKSLSTGEGS